MFGESGKDGKGPPHIVGTPALNSLRPHPSRSELWKSAYSRRGSRAVLLNELRLQGGIACAAQLLVTAVLPSVLYAQFYSLDGRLLHIPITTWVSSSLTCFLGISGLVLLRSQLLGLHVALALALGAALGAYHTGTYIVMKDRCDRIQASFLGCSASASASSCACAASSSCNREALRSPACAGCRAWPTDVCSKVNGVLPYMGLIMLVFMAAPAVYSLLVLMRLEKSHSDLASRVAYARAMVLRELDRLQSGGVLGLDPRVLSHLMATLLRHGGRADEGPVREVRELLRLEPRGLEVEWRDMEAAGGGGSSVRPASSMAAPSLAAGSSYFAGRGGEISAATAATAPPVPPPPPPASAAAATAAARAIRGAAPPVATNSHPGPPPGAPAAAAAAVSPAAAAAGTAVLARPIPAPVRAWSPQQTALQTAVAASTGPEPGSGSGSGLRTGSAAAAAAAAAGMAAPPGGLSAPPPLALAAGGSSTRQRSIVWQKLNMSPPLDPAPGPEGPPGAGEISAAASRRGSVVLGSSGSARGAGAPASGPAASGQQAASAGLRGSSAAATNAWRDSGGGGAPAAVGAAGAAEVEAFRPPTAEGGDAPGDRPPPGAAAAAAAAAPQSGGAVKLPDWQPSRRGSGARGEAAIADIGPSLSSTAAVSRKSRVAPAAEEAEGGPGSASRFILGGSRYGNAALGTAAAAAEAAETAPVVAPALPRPAGAPGVVEVEAQPDVSPQAGLVGVLDADRTAVHHFKTPKSLSRARTKKQLM